MSRLKYFFPVILVSLTSCSGCHNGMVQATSQDKQLVITPFLLSSPAFHDGDTIPSIYTCDSTDISPALHWNNPFNNVASFVLIMDDPDAPMGTWVHWIVYNIPAADTVLSMHFPKDSAFSNGIKQGYTSFCITGYGGPCPPDGVHRYFFKLYALDAKLNAPAGLSKSQLLNTMKGHILAEADLMGKYIRKKNSH